MLPEHVRISKHLRVSIEQLCVKVVDQSNQVVILDEKLGRKWKASEASWSVIAGKKLQITVGMFGLLVRHKYLLHIPKRSFDYEVDASTSGNNKAYHSFSRQND